MRSPKLTSFIHLVKTVIGPVIFLLSITVLYRLFKQHPISEIIHEIKNIDRSGLMIACVLTVLNYWLLTLYDTLAFVYIAEPLKYIRIALATFISYTFSHNIGFAVLSGGAVRYHFYSRWGITGAKVAQIITFSGLHFWMGLIVLGAIACFVSPIGVAETFRASTWVSYLIGSGMLGCITTYLIFIYRKKEPLRYKEWTLPLPSLTLSFSALLVSSVDWVLAASILYFLLPPSNDLHYSHVLFAFFLGQLAGILSHVPGGLGVFEGSIVLGLKNSYPASTLLGSLIVFRVLYYLIPFLLGALSFAVYEIKQKGAKAILKSEQSSIIQSWLSASVPPVLALSTFIGGALLLFSGATPAWEDHISKIADFMPLVFIEASHFVNSIVGTVLLFIAWSIYKRIDAAYRITLFLLFVGVVVSLAKGFDYEEALYLTVVFTLLYPCKRYFYRKTMLLANFSWGTLIAIAFVIGCSIWLGFFSFRHIEYKNTLWWQFGLFSDAPRFLRGSIAAMILAILLSLKTLFKPKPPKFTFPSEEELTKAQTIIGRSSSTASLLALLGDKYLLFNDEGTAFLMFRILGNSWIALGDPVGEESTKKDLIWKFRLLCDTHDGWCVFYEVDGEHLSYYVDCALALLKLGEEAIVDLPAFSLEGSSMKAFRSTLRKLEKEGYTCTIHPTEKTPELLPQLKVVSDLWLEEKKTREKGFSIGFFDEDYLKRCPIAVVEKEGEIMAFANVWRTSTKHELSVDLMRHRPGTSNGIMDFLFLNLMIWGKNEGYETFNLGMAPLSGLVSRPFVPLWNRLGALLYKHAEHFYNFEGIRNYKEKYSPRWESRYLASPGGVRLPRIFTNIATLISGSVKGLVSR